MNRKALTGTHNSCYFEYYLVKKVQALTLPGNMVCVGHIVMTCLTAAVAASSLRSQR